MPTDSPYAPDELLTALGQAIVRVRKERKLTQEELAQEATIDRAYMSSIERGRQNIGVIHLARVAYALGITMADLLAEAGI